MRCTYCAVWCEIFLVLTLLKEGGSDWIRSSRAFPIALMGYQVAIAWPEQAASSSDVYEVEVEVEDGLDGGIIGANDLEIMGMKMG